MAPPTVPHPAASRILRSLQFSYLIGAAMLVPALLATAVILLLPIHTTDAWIAASLISLASPLLQYVLASRLYHSNSIRTEAQLRSYAEAIALKTVSDNRYLLIAIALTAFTLLGLGASQVYAVATLPIKGLLLTNLTAVTWILLRIHGRWFNYFYLAKKVGLNQLRADTIYRSAAQHAVTHSRRTLAPVRYDNYCAICQGVCSKTVIYQGSRSMFLVYPFSSPHQDHMRQLRDHLTRRGYSALLPESDVAEILVCKLCKSILGCQSLIANVTSANRNVYFEIGLAKGFGKTTWLLTSNSRLGPMDHPLLHDTTRIQQETFSSNHAASRIQKDATSQHDRTGEFAPRHIKLQDFHTLPTGRLDVAILLTPCMFSAHARCSDPIYTEINAVLRDRLAEQGLTAIEHLPQQGSHVMAAMLKRIRDAKIVIGVFANDSTQESEDINCLVAYLIGFALAQQKRLIVFQHMPCTQSMIDLHGQVQTFQTLQQLDQTCPPLLQSVLNHRTPDIYLTPPG